MGESQAKERRGKARAAAGLKVLDFTHANESAVADTLAAAIEQLRQHDTDGAIVILSNRNGAPTWVRTAGRLNQADQALLQLFRLQVNMAYDE